MLPVDRGTSAAQQFVLGLSAWAFLGIALRLQLRELRVQVLVLVGVATVLEVIGSIVWGAYRYRLENLPVYVPAGHGLFYLSALRLAALPAIARHSRAITIAVTVGATLYMLRNLTLPLPDLLGFVTWAIFLRFIVRGTAPLLYAVSFAITSVRALHVALVDEHGDLAARRDLITAPEPAVDSRRDACRAETRSDQLCRRLVIRERDTDLSHHRIRSPLVSARTGSHAPALLDRCARRPRPPARRTDSPGSAARRAQRRESRPRPSPSRTGARRPSDERRGR